MHFVGNHLIELDDADHAHGSVYCWAQLDFGDELCDSCSSKSWKPWIHVMPFALRNPSMLVPSFHLGGYFEFDCRRSDKFSAQCFRDNIFVIP